MELKNRALVLICIERPDMLADNDALVHEVVNSISFGKPIGVYAGEITFKAEDDDARA